MAFSDRSPRPSRLSVVLGPPRPRAWRPAPHWAVAGDAEPVTEPITLEDVLAGEPRAHDPGGAAAEPVRGRLGSVLRRCRPAAWRGARVDPGRPGATALVLVAIAAALLAAGGVWSQRPQVQPVGGLPTVTTLVDSAGGADSEAAAGPTPGGGPGLVAGPAAGTDAARPEPVVGSGAGAATAPAPPAAPLVVNVSGKVRRPGLVELPAGARVADAVAAAGGALPGTDLAQLNLARKVGDGEQVAVGVPAAPDAAAPSGAASAATAPGSTGNAAGVPAGRIDLNGATVGQLDGLPGVGPVTAQRILDWRTRYGRFSRVEQLREIEGIGERRFAQLRELVTV